MVDASGNGARMLGQVPAIYPMRSSDGASIIYTMYVGSVGLTAQYRIFKLDASNSMPQQLFGNNPVEMAFDWSTATNRLLVSLGSRLATTRPDGTDIQFVTGDLYGLFFARFSPDGDRVVFGGRVPPVSGGSQLVTGFCHSPRRGASAYRTESGGKSELLATRWESAAWDWFAYRSD